MLDRLHTLLHVLPDERQKVLHFALFIALLQAGVAIGMTAADSLFLTHLGAEKLPIVYICMPVVMTVYASLYSTLLARLGIDRVVHLTLAVLVAGSATFGIGAHLVGENTAWYLYAGKFFAGLWFIALYTLFWNFADDYFNILDSKRLYGVIAAGGSLGGILGASLVAVLTRLLPPAQIYFAWSLLALLAIPVFNLLRRRHVRIEPDEAQAEEAAGPVAVLRSVLEAFGTSRFALGLTIACFAAVNLTGVLEYLSMGVLAQGKSPAELAQLLGVLYAVANGVTLVINLTLFGRIVGRVGVGNTALVLPLAYLGVFIFFYLQQGTIAAVLAFYAYQTVLPGIEYNNVNLLFSALPARVKPLLRTFVEAMAEPLATAFAGLFLLSLATRLGRENIALAGLLAACGALAIALLVRFDYVGALAHNLRRDWLNFADSEQDWANSIAADDRALLRAKAAQGNRREQFVAVDLLWRARDPEAPAALLRLLASATPDEIPRLREVLALLLQSENPETIAQVSLWLESDAGPSAPELVDEFAAAGLVSLRRLQAWRHSRQPPHRAVTAVAQWQASCIEESTAALAVVRDLLAGNPIEQRWALRAVGDFRQTSHAEAALPFLDHPDHAVRREALRTLGKLASPKNPHLAQRVLPLVARAEPEERRLILRVVARVGDPSALIPLLHAAAHFTTNEARELEAVVVELGLKTIPAVIQNLRDTTAPYHGRSVAARALSRLAMPQLILLAEDLVSAELALAQARVLAFRSVSAAVPSTGFGLAVLARYYRDASIESLEFTLELLSLAGRLPDYDLIRASLSFANPKDRANAIETIQQSCTRPQFEQILFVIEQTDPAGRVRAPKELPSIASVLQRAADSSFELEAAAALVAGRQLGLDVAEKRVRERLAGREGTAIPPAFLALLPQFNAGPEGSRHNNSVGRVAALLYSTFLRDARLPALEFLATQAAVRLYAPGELVYEQAAAVEPVLYVVAAGAVAVSRPGRATEAGPGAVFGERVLTGETQRSDRAVAQGAELVVLPAAAVTRAIEIFPALGITLYRFKTISAVA